MLTDLHWFTNSATLTNSVFIDSSPPYTETSFVFFRSVINTSRNLTLQDVIRPWAMTWLALTIGSHLLFPVLHCYLLQYVQWRKILVLNHFIFFDCRYNVVFKYLLSVRRVQAELQHCWALQMQRKHLKSNRTDAIKWRLRDHMAFLVDNLQYYLQVSITEKDKLYQLIRNWHKCMEGALKTYLRFLIPCTLRKSGLPSQV